MGLPIRDSLRHTYAEYRSWREDARYELVDGVAYLMAPARSVEHQTVAAEMYRQIANALASTPCRAFIAPVAVVLVRQQHENEGDADTVVQPDVFVVCDARKISSQGIRGAPDWVVEVLSPLTAGHDQIVKRRAYERAGVHELWFVHPTDRVVTVHRLGDDRRYGVPEVLECHDETGPAAVAGVSIGWAEVFARVEPPA
jgi:Uma2 family endonuclease